MATTDDPTGGNPDDLLREGGIVQEREQYWADKFMRLVDEKRAAEAALAEVRQQLATSQQDVEKLRAELQRVDCKEDESPDTDGILQSVLMMLGLGGYREEWFTANGEWDFGKLRANGLDDYLKRTRAAEQARDEARQQLAALTAWKAQAEDEFEAAREAAEQQAQQLAACQAERARATEGNFKASQAFDKCYAELSATRLRAEKAEAERDKAISRLSVIKARWKLAVRPWLDKMIGRPATLTFGEWDAVCEELEQALTGIEPKIAGLRVTAARDLEYERRLEVEARLKEAEAALAACQAERDKWLEAFNKSEQFQNGPTTRAERLADQARDLSVLLSEAGFNAMPIPEVVRRLVNERDALAAQIATLRTAAEEAISFLRSVEWSDATLETNAYDCVEGLRAALAAVPPAPPEAR